ncbi:hypothetical protein FHR90_003426 [Endobacter medicaginis]|uniref:Uncharacterized protein n=1 Tax=Endobacter medicaginis TaxID=1181271 RepID=A0A839V3Z7_9PROT|nr:hypothetical protein [Endobacter medicaginis]
MTQNTFGTALVSGMMMMMERHEIIGLMTVLKLAGMRHALTRSLRTPSSLTTPSSTSLATC